MKLVYAPDPGHLWFLKNIFIYVLIFSPLFYLMKRNEHGRVVSWIRKAFSSPLAFLIVAGFTTLEAVILKPYPYELYATTWHGFWIGFLAFFFGFCFVLTGDGFTKMIVRWRWAFLAIAVALFVVRLAWFSAKTPYYLIALESDGWIFSVLAFGYRYLNHDGKALRYLSQAAYPVYILHMIFLYFGALIIFPMTMPVQLKFVLLLLFTVAGCFLTFELIRRLKWVKPLFGLKFKDKEPSPTVTPTSSYSPG
jgi:hypothetical protein